MNNTQNKDQETEALLSLLSQQEQVRTNKVPGVRTVLVILSSRAMVFDTESLRQKVLLTYPEAAVFFKTTLGKSVGSDCPEKVDLVIDFTGPKMKAPLFYAQKLRRMGRVTVGRKTGILRPRLYDRVLDESSFQKQSLDLLEYERQVQQEVLKLVGISLTQKGDTLTDQSKTIALELPSMARLH